MSACASCARMAPLLAEVLGRPLSALVVKAVADRVLALVGLLLLLPVLLLLALAVRLSSPGPALFRQTRVGLAGRPFTMLKFRTMALDAESRTGPVWAATADPRATPLGRWLRRTSLDELPQLVNVLRGEMSLVGPRPERPEFLAAFEAQHPGYGVRHLVRPGITGLAQVEGWRGATELGPRLECDLLYIRHWSLGLDVAILVRTLAGGFWA